ncbi:MAG: hypothetical protein FWF06_02635 [Symbiobacteriaceae bacterium]|nr:hypothetical protein [Symbiobacteriaceae bacterium]
MFNPFSLIIILLFLVLGLGQARSQFIASEDPGVRRTLVFQVVLVICLVATVMVASMYM